MIYIFRSIKYSILLLVALLPLAVPFTSSAHPVHRVAESHAEKPVIQRGRASFYSNWFNGRRTASGDIFSNSKMTAAHMTLPFGTRVQVTNLRNGRKAIVTINDRGPYVSHRIIDLSRAAAEHLHMVDSGVQHVQLKILN
ncbi:Endolytic peptidoglycan transglycosylase RlpA [Halomonadaceae bacterium LMG 33818]|uniref:septal ring lytic transglycosylase RlpA family protein n=1 Tax=Cernens ardua TaxID=3402176 RepID=UPI003EDBECBE